MGIVVVGAGAIGMLVAGRLAGAGEQVTLLVRPHAVEALAGQGLIIKAGDRSLAVKDVRPIADPADLNAPPELAILCVKGYDTEGALPTLAALEAKLVLTLQNGIGNEETLASRFGTGRILSGAITTSVEVEAPGRIVITKEGGVGLASIDGGPPPTSWAARFAAAGFVARTYGDYRALKWSKALLNMLGNATAAILDMPVAEVYADRRLVAVERACFREALAVMDHLGIRTVNLPRYPAAALALAMRAAPPALLDPLLRRLIAGGRGGKPPSLQLDLARGSPRSEGELLYGAVARAAEAHRLEAPVNRGLWETLQAIATGATPWDRYRRRPAELLASLGARGVAAAGAR